MVRQDTSQSVSDIFDTNLLAIPPSSNGIICNSMHSVSYNADQYEVLYSQLQGIGTSTQTRAHVLPSSL